MKANEMDQIAQLFPLATQQEIKRFASVPGLWHVKTGQREKDARSFVAWLRSKGDAAADHIADELAELFCLQ